MSKPEFALFFAASIGAVGAFVAVVWLVAEMIWLYRQHGKYPNLKRPPSSRS